MESLKKIDFKKISIPKAIGVLVLGLVVFVIAVWLLGFAFRAAFYGGGYVGESKHSYAEPAAYYADDVAYEIEEGFDHALSVRNVAPIPVPGDGTTTGTDAENFEVTHYNGHIKTGSVDRVCTEIEDLKQLEHVIFEHANRYDRGCNYNFKVENDRADEVLAVIKGLKPESLNESTRTIKNQVDDFTSEVEILEKKLESIETTLLDAQAAYDQVEILATRAQDVESLAQIIDSKIGLIERLTNERINIKERIDRINRNKADQLDRLEFTFFSLSVFEDQIIDLEGLKDSWVWEIKRFVNEFNDVLQKVTINLVGFLLQLVWIVLYLTLALLVAKYGWRGIRYIWKK